jgi:hypothetical protein
MPEPEAKQLHSGQVAPSAPSALSGAAVVPVPAAAQPVPVPGRTVQSGATPAFKFGQHVSAEPASTVFQFGGAKPASTVFQFGGFGSKSLTAVVTNTTLPAGTAIFQRARLKADDRGDVRPASPQTVPARPAPEAEELPNAVPEAYDAQAKCLVSFYAVHDRGKGESDCKAILDKRLAGGTGGLSTLKFSKLCSVLQKKYGANPLEDAKPKAATLADSPFALLDARSSLRLVTDVVHEDDALCLALTCRALRVALWARFPRRPAGDTCAGVRVRTRDAAVVGTMGRLAWARGLDRPWPEPRNHWQPWQICVTAARHGALASLQWARANRCPCNKHACRAAARFGHLAVLQWLRANGCGWDEDTCQAAAGGGHLDVLQWARANGCDWDERTCSRAAGGGHLAVLQWARATGSGAGAAAPATGAGGDWGRAPAPVADCSAPVAVCDWDKDTCSEAAGGGHLEVLQWLRANGCPWPLPWDIHPCSAAAGGGHLAVLQWERDNGCAWYLATCLE